MNNQTDVYEKITASIIEAIEAGCGKFEMPWHTFGALPSNAVNRRRYRGINVLALWANASRCGYKTQLWATYQQWRVRVNGKRRYSSVQRMAVLRLAQACGFRLDEMRHLMHGFAHSVTPARRWQELARRKQQEIELQIARLKAMQRVVDRVLECRCVELRECGRIAASIMETTK